MENLGLRNQNAKQSNSTRYASCVFLRCQFAEVDHMEDADTIKLKRDSAGKHHYIPLSWVTSVEGGKVKIDRPGEEAMQEWSETPPI